MIGRSEESLRLRTEPERVDGVYIEGAENRISNGFESICG